MSSRTPHGVRGLKFKLTKIVNKILRSHPARGAWIEILIELSYQLNRDRRTPHGVRGLKFFGRTLLNALIGVAPRTGCVD